MHILIKLFLLGLTFFLVFINPAYIGKAVYYALFPVLFLLVGWLYYISYVVKEKEVKAVSSEHFSYSIFCAMVPIDGEGDLKRGRLVVTEHALKLYQRSKGKEGRCKMTWSLALDSIQEVSVESVFGNRKGFKFHLEDYSVAFVYRNADKQKDALIRALGWEVQPEVGSDASSAPSFKDL